MLIVYLETYRAKTNADHQTIPANVNISDDEEQHPSEEEDTADITAGESNEKDLNPRDHVVLTASCKSISPCIAAVGSLAITTTALYFSLDEEHPDNQKLDPKVSVLSCCGFFFTIYATFHNEPQKSKINYQQRESNVKHSV